jgi:hypothetical protein
MELGAGVICARGAPNRRNSPAHPRPGTPDLLQAAKAPLAQPIWPDSARMLISQLSHGRILAPWNAPRQAAAYRFIVRFTCLTCRGDMGIRTPDLLHAMNHSPGPRPGDMQPDQAECELTQAAPSLRERLPRGVLPLRLPLGNRSSRRPAIDGSAIEH